MYISRIEIDTTNRGKVKDLTHVGAYHHWVESAFPDEIEKHIRSRKLWRIDRIGGKDYLLLVSDDQPNKDKLARYGKESSLEIKAYDMFLSALQEGQLCRFRIILNPVISIPDKEGQRGKVKPHITIEHQMNYFLNRAEKNGFELVEKDVSITDREFVVLKKAQRRDVKLVKVTYEGVLKIIDLDKFRAILTEGMGKKKAYGFGLMTVIPLE